ncbi:sensor domain-containing diguanylate cyclase [Marinobacterium sp. MBR-109]|uniref:sensor domain-containing diguanylate cyclase n=1 Tax=Marinobacterium sp. MBR-109 TaxID=3156462 RepID=UPI0033953B05
MVSLLITLLLAWMMLHLHQQRHAIQVQKYRLDAIGAAVGEGIYVLDTEGRTLYVNKAVSHLTGYNEQKLYHENLHQLLHQHEENDLPLQQCPIVSKALKGITFEGDEQFKTRTGELLPVVVTSQPMIERGQITGVVTVFRDISDRKEAERKLKRLATTDSLTGLSNRRALLERLHEEQRLSKRLGHPSSLLMIDFDHFKQINDEYGHNVGDLVLQHFASLARSCLRETDSIGRLGGEEFAILLPGTDLEGAVQLAERLRHLLEQTPTETTDGPVPMTLSIGVTTLHASDTTSSELLSRADAALYQAKSGGRNRIEVRH